MVKFSSVYHRCFSSSGDVLKWGSICHHSFQHDVNDDWWQIINWSLLDHSFQYECQIGTNNTQNQPPRRRILFAIHDLILWMIWDPLRKAPAMGVAFVVAWHLSHGFFLSRSRCWLPGGSWSRKWCGSSELSGYTCMYVFIHTYIYIYILHVDVYMLMYM